MIGHLCKHVHCVHALQMKTSTHSLREKSNATVCVQSEQEDGVDVDMVTYGESCIIPSQD